MIQYDEGGWPEDALLDDDNGCYQRECIECHKLFIGHKRRYICKVCATSSVGSQLREHEG